MVDASQRPLCFGQYRPGTEACVRLCQHGLFGNMTCRFHTLSQLPQSYVEKFKQHHQEDIQF